MWVCSYGFALGRSRFLRREEALGPDQFDKPLTNGRQDALLTDERAAYDNVPVMGGMKMAKQQVDKRPVDYDSVDWGASLDVVLKQLIAARDGISPSDVTVEYIRRERKRRIYPGTRFAAGSRYGGYSTRRLRFRSRQEQARVTRAAEKIMKRF